MGEPRQAGDCRRKPVSIIVNKAELERFREDQEKSLRIGA